MMVMFISLPVVIVVTVYISSHVVHLKYIHIKKIRPEKANLREIGEDWPSLCYERKVKEGPPGGSVH